jgi:hypothetical protein
MKKYLFCILAGLASAIAFSSLPLGGVKSLPAMFLSAAFPIGTGLLFGLTPAIIGVLTATALLVFMHPYLGGIYIVSDAMPVIIIIALATYYNKKQVKNPLGKLVSWVNLFGAVGAGAISQMIINNMSLQGVDVELSQGIYEMLEQGFVASGNNELVTTLINSLVPFFIYMVTISWLTHVLLGAAVGDVVARKIGKTILKPDFKNFRVPNWSIVIIPLFAILGLISDGNVRYLGINISLILTTPLTLQGLAYCHRKIEKIRFASALMILFYIILFFIGLWAVAVLLVFGIVEYFSNRDKIDEQSLKRQEN